MEYDVDVEAARAEASMHRESAGRLRDELEALRTQYQREVQAGLAREASLSEERLREVDRLCALLAVEQSKAQEVERTRVFLSERYTQVATGTWAVIPHVYVAVPARRHIRLSQRQDPLARERCALCTMSACFPCRAVRIEDGRGRPSCRAVGNPSS
jgi:hypothetical protein